MISLLLVAIVVLIGIVIFQIARANELTSVLKDEHEGDVSPLATNVMGYFFLAFLILGMVGVYLGYAIYKDKFLPDASSEHGKELDSMFWMTTYITGIVFFITQILLFWFAFKYKSGKGNPGYYFPHSNKIEIIWTTVPAVVMTVLVIFGLRAWLKTTGPAPNEAMEVEALAEQFQWNIRYAGPDGKLGKRRYDLIKSDNPFGIDYNDPNSHDDFSTTEIHLPVNKPVLFRLGAKDVLHAFYLPHFRVKLDCVPGIPTQFWFTPTKTSVQEQQDIKNPEFTYLLACAELCGSSHWGMRRDVIVETDEEFQAWFNKQTSMYSTWKASKDAPKSTETKQITLDNEGQAEAHSGTVR